MQLLKHLINTYTQLLGTGSSVLCSMFFFVNVVTTLFNITDYDAWAPMLVPCYWLLKTVHCITTKRCVGVGCVVLVFSSKLCYRCLHLGGLVFCNMKEQTCENMCWGCWLYMKCARLSGAAIYAVWSMALWFGLWSVSFYKKMLELSIWKSHTISLSRNS